MLEGKKGNKRNSELPRNVQLLHLKKVLKYTYKHAAQSHPLPSPLPLFSSNHGKSSDFCRISKIKNKKKIK